MLFEKVGDLEKACDTKPVPMRTALLVREECGGFGI